ASIFFFSSRRRHTRFSRDWSSDVCSSDLTHGFWVSPQGNSDNIFLKFKPQEKFDYQFKMEPNHPAGTYWYHAHLHGSTALQVSRSEERRVGKECSARRRPRQ